MEHELGPLPEDLIKLDEVYCGLAVATQVRAYALAEVSKAVAAERERCAKVCEQMAVEYWDLYKGNIPNRPKEERASPYLEGMSDAADLCAQQIRVG